MEASSPPSSLALAPSPSDNSGSSSYSLQALTMPMIIIIVVACLVNVISIVLVSRYLYLRWKSIMAEQEDAENSATAAQQGKELSMMEAQLQRSTPIVVLQPDSRVMCAHRDKAFVEAAKLKTEQPISALDTTVTSPGGGPAFPVITGPSGLPTDSAMLPHSASTGVLSAVGDQGMHDSILSHPGELYRNSDEAESSSDLYSHPESFYQNAAQAGSSSSLHSQDADAEQNSDDGFHFQQPGNHFRHPEDHASHGFSDRHRNGSAVSLCSLAGSDVSTGSMTYVTELPQGSSLFYEGPREDLDA